MARFKTEDDFHKVTLRVAGHAAGHSLGEIIDRAKCESPIERMLFAALYSWFRFGTPVPFFYAGSSAEDDPYDDVIGIIRLYSQLPVGDYRIDIALKLRLGNGRQVGFAIECDGFDFHERTKEQAARDRAKDRKVQSLGYTIYRFTGSEIWASPVRCATEVATNFLKKANQESAE